MPFDISSLLQVHDQALTFISIFVFVFGVLSLGRQYVLLRTRSWAEKTPTKLDDFLIDVLSIWDFKIIGIFSMYLAIRVVIVDEVILAAFQTFFNLSLIVFVTLSLQKVSIGWLHDYLKIADEKETDEYDPTMIMFIERGLQVVLWSIVSLVLLQNFGFNITALIGGLGIGGIAVAFAVQNILGDLFSSVSLYFDKPFKVGDYIEVGDDEGGTVKKIGLKTTRLETILGDQLIISNRDLTELRIHNYERLERRRVIRTIPVDVRTHNDAIRAFIDELPKRFEAIETSTYLRTYFKKITDVSYELELAYFVNSNDYVRYLEVNNDVNFQVTQLLSDFKIQLPYGKQEVLLQK